VGEGLNEIGFCLTLVMDNDQQKLFERITVSSDLFGGKPAIRGLRFLVSDVLELLSTGMSRSEIIEQHTILEKEDIQAALLYAATKINYFSSFKEGVFIIPEYMKEGIRQGEEDIKNGRVHTIEELKKRYKKYLD
jgi:uncharacterized protein (DUF433 family)